MTGTAFRFQEGKVQRINLQFQAWNLYQKMENI